MRCFTFVWDALAQTITLIQIQTFNQNTDRNSAAGSVPVWQYGIA